MPLSTGIAYATNDCCRLTEYPRLRFYEKVIKVKADVAALLILFSPTSTTLRPVAWRTVKGAVFWRSS